MADSETTWAAVGRAVARRLRATKDPVHRAMQAAVELEELKLETRHVSQIRLEAIGDLRELGWSYGNIATALGITRERAAQLSREALTLKETGFRHFDHPPRSRTKKS